ncbi:MAG: xanthine dehydrogenase small subunit [Beijerinckiaceae bacterium]
MTDSRSFGAARDALRFVFRGAEVSLRHFPPSQTLLDWLRREQHATGVKEGCAEGDCGACTVVLHRLVDGRATYTPVNACILLLGQVDGAEILTVEDLAVAGALHPVQQALITHHGSQCGFCTPGIAMSLFALHARGDAAPTRAAVNDVLAGNLCRCTGYRPIIDAAIDACAQTASPAFDAQRVAARAMLAAWDESEDVFVGNADEFFAAPADEKTFAAMLRDYPDAVILGGATDYGLQITKALAQPQKIIGLGRVAALRRIAQSADGVTIGAGVSVAALAQPLAAIDPDLGEVVRRFGSEQVRASATIGGNIANGSPVGDLAPALIALGATLELRRGNTVRKLPLEDFFLAYKKQDRQPGEYVARLVVPTLRTGQHYRAFKLSKRFDEDISAVFFAGLFDVAEGRIQSARLAFGAMAGTPARARRAEAALAHVSLHDEAAWETALHALDADFSPLSDQRASAAYRRQTAKALLRKALLELADPQTEVRLTGARSRREVSHATG